MTDITFHYPPELFDHLVDVIPLLSKSKQNSLLFLKGAGVPDSMMRDLSDRVAFDRTNITKYEIARTVLTRLNEKGEKTLRARREILKRVTEFENFSSCWPDDQLKARGLIAEIRDIINVKDSFTRMKIEREKEVEEKRKNSHAQLAKVRKRKEVLASLRHDLNSLFILTDAQKRGKQLEQVLNRLFQFYEISIREAFTLTGNDGEGIVEQIDGVVEIDGSIYLVEMKWWEKPIGRGEVSQHLVRIFSRGHARGIFISNSGFTEPAITICRESLSRTTVVLCLMEEIVKLLAAERSLKDLLKAKIEAAIIDKNPFHRVD